MPGFTITSQCGKYVGSLYETRLGNVSCHVYRYDPGASHWFFDRIVADYDGFAGMIKNSAGKRVDMYFLRTPREITYLKEDTLGWFSDTADIRVITETFDAFFKWLDDGREMFEAHAESENGL